MGTEKIGNIPLEAYLKIMSYHRFFDLETTLFYTKEIYGVDLSCKEIPGYIIWSKENPNKEFQSILAHYPKYTDQRTYFDKVVRKIYREYLINYIYLRYTFLIPETANFFMRYIIYDFIKDRRLLSHPEFKDAVKFHKTKTIDMVNSFMAVQFADEIHHVCPLSCGGDNSFYNLVSIRKSYHDILHENPFYKEKNKNKAYYHKAFDYLVYLRNYGFLYLNNKYGFLNLKPFEHMKKALDLGKDISKDKNISIIANILDKLVEVEMIEFYKELKKNAKKK